ncbi:MAG: GNAT family N-acetyltransferase, partial [Erythrobacteraceae bacterium]
MIRVTDLSAYTPEQVATWAARYPGAERFIASAAKGDTILVAVDAEDAPLAFALTVPDGHCDMLYCHPDHAGRGLAAALLAETEIFARGANY